MFPVLSVEAKIHEYKYWPLWEVYAQSLCPKAIEKLNEHRLKNVKGIDGMEDGGFVTIDFIDIESVFLAP